MTRAARERPKDPSATEHAHRGTALRVALALFVLAALCFTRTIAFDFVTVDDQAYVERNPVVLRGLSWDGLRWAFTTFHATNWHPLTWLSHMLDVELFGPGASGPHAVNVCLHALNTVLLFGWLRAATGAVVRSALVAALFAVHPLHVESVAWISERKDLLAACFWFAATWVWIAWTRSGRARFYALSIVACAAALLAKPMPVTLPFALLLLDVWPLGRLDGWRALGRRVLEKAPLFALALASSIVTWHAQSTGALSTLANVSFGERAANAVVSYGLYLARTFLPLDLTAFHPHPALEDAHHPAGLVALALAVLIAISVLAWRWRRTRAWFPVGWCWYLGTLVPVIGLVQVGLQAHADRYTYVPLVGVFVALVWAAHELVERFRVGRELRVLLAGGVLVALAAASWESSAHWRNGVALFQRCVAVHPRSATAWAALGDSQLEQGTVDGALEAYGRALSLDGSLARAVIGMGTALGRAGRVEEALALCERSVQLAPRDPAAWFNLGAARGNAGKTADARAAFAECARIAPDDVSILEALCRAQFTVGDEAGALVILARLEQLDPVRAAEARKQFRRGSR